jgi:predicted amino acid racemase
MSAPRLEIRLDRIHHNASRLVQRLAARGISVTGITKATLGSPEVASELLRAGVTSIGDSRIENIEAMRLAGVSSTMTLIRSPMLSQADQVVAHAEVSLNSELDVIARLSTAAVEQRRTHGVVLMVELGDLREGILPGDLDAVIRQTLHFPGIALRGIGTNLACQSGVAPDERNMAELSALATSLESTFGIGLDVVSGGNSANLDWAFGAPDVGRINDLRLGEAILLGREPLQRRPIDGLHTDAFTLVAEVIESKTKPSLAWGAIHQTAFGLQSAGPDRGDTARVILAIGRQDVDPAGLEAPAGLAILGASSDHLVVDAGRFPPAVGSEVAFQLNYSALLAAMTSPFVSRVFTRGSCDDEGTS